MTREELCAMKDRIHKGMDMVMEKAETFGREKKEWGLNELSTAADIVKDMAEAYKDMAKAHYLYSEHSVEKY